MLYSTMSLKYNSFLIKGPANCYGLGYTNAIMMANTSASDPNFGAIMKKISKKLALLRKRGA